MLHVKIPIADFLRKALSASRETDVVALMVVIARSADAAAFQDQIIDHWESLDDLTHREILILTPRPAETSPANVIAGLQNRHTVLTDQLAMTSGVSDAWADAFDRSLPSTDMSIDALKEEYGEYRGPPTDARALKAAMTASATDTAAVFGLGESDLPCLVVVVPHEYRIFAIRIPDSFSLYRFARAMLIECEPVLTALRAHSAEGDEIERRIRRAKDDLEDWRGARPARPNPDEHPASQWGAERRRITGHLEYLGETSTEFSIPAMHLLNWFRSDEHGPRTEVMEVGRELLRSLQNQWAAAGVARDRYNGIARRLLHAINSRPTVQQITDYEAKIERRQADTWKAIEDKHRELANQISLLRKRKGEIESAARQERASLDWAKKIETILLREGFASVPGAPITIRDLPLYRLHVVSRTGAAATSQVERPEYDIAISYAREDSTAADAIAQKLRDANLRVFFDKFERYTLWGTNLVDYLTEVYFSRARFCLMLVSESYAAKAWTKLERQAMQARMLESQREYILPVSLDGTIVPGLLPTVAYLDLDTDGVDGIVKGVIAKCKARA